MRNAAVISEESVMSNMGGKLLLLAVSAALAAGCQQGEEADRGAKQAEAGQKGETAQGGTIGQALSQSTDHSNFVGAVKAAGLDGTMSGSQPYTVFAPSNAAFQKLPAGAAEGLMQPAQKGQLTAIVTHHIVPGVVTAQDLTRAIEKGGGKAQIATMGGGTLTATQSDGAIMLADAKGAQARVTPSDQAHSNGVVHTIDTILMPR
ncbi:MAG TPA: fasciclin domain-containing protein [Allosphingosinicella sp.]|nr:fasciclin domain-containing protein [Allosphingosinicella sp.]